MTPTGKPIKRAAALSYDPAKDSVPLLTAYGEGFLAEKIIARAEEMDVPLMVDAGLAQMLGKMSVGDEIPPELYGAVAQILVFLSESDQAFGERLQQATRRSAAN